MSSSCQAEESILKYSPRGESPRMSLFSVFFSLQILDVLLGIPEEKPHMGLVPRAATRLIVSTVVKVTL